MGGRTMTLSERLRSGVALVGDGAMGTALQSAGLDDGGAPELWNVDHADVVRGILRGYAAAGATLLTTNTFGGSRPRLDMHGLGDRVHELNRAAAELARSVADEFTDVYVLGDIGPLGDLMEPMGTLTPETAVEFFAEQIAGLVDGGVDGVVIETMSDLSEVEAAVRATQQVAPGLPIFATMSFDTNLRTMMGVKPGVAVQRLAELGVAAAGANCGRGYDEARIIVREMVEARPEGLLLMAQPNAGLPKLVGASFEYDGTPEDMASLAIEMRGLGIDIVGACCGSTAEHVHAIRSAV